MLFCFFCISFLASFFFSHSDVPLTETKKKTYSVDQVQLPQVTSKVLKREGIGVDVECQTGLDADVHDHEALCAQLVRQDLDGVTDEQAGPGERVKDAVDPNKENHGEAGAVQPLLLVQARGQRPKDKGEEHAAGRGEEHGPAADAVDQQRHADGDDGGQDGLAAGQAELVGRALDAGRVVENRDVIGDDGVAGPLGEDAERDQDGEAVAVALCAQELGVLGVFFFRQRLFSECLVLLVAEW